jgi:hypothetical protein
VECFRDTDEEDDGLRAIVEPEDFYAMKQNAAHKTSKIFSVVCILDTAAHEIRTRAQVSAYNSLTKNLKKMKIDKAFVIPDVAEPNCTCVACGDVCIYFSKMDQYLQNNDALKWIFFFT